MLDACRESCVIVVVDDEMRNPETDPRSDLYIYPLRLVGGYTRHQSQIRRCSQTIRRTDGGMAEPRYGLYLQRGI